MNSQIVIDKLINEVKKLSKNEFKYEEWIGFGHHLDILEGWKKCRFGIMNDLLMARKIDSDESEIFFLADGVDAAVSKAIAFMVG